MNRKRDQAMSYSDDEVVSDIEQQFESEAQEQLPPTLTQEEAHVELFSKENAIPVNIHFRVPFNSKTNVAKAVMSKSALDKLSAHIEAKTGKKIDLNTQSVGITSLAISKEPLKAPFELHYTATALNGQPIVKTFNGETGAGVTGTVHPNQPEHTETVLDLKNDHDDPVAIFSEKELGDLKADLADLKTMKLKHGWEQYTDSNDNAYAFFSKNSALADHLNEHHPKLVNQVPNRVIDMAEAADKYAISEANMEKIAPTIDALASKNAVPSKNPFRGKLGNLSITLSRTHAGNFSAENTPGVHPNAVAQHDGAEHVAHFVAKLQLVHPNVLAADIHDA